MKPTVVFEVALNLEKPRSRLPIRVNLGVKFPLSAEDLFHLPRGDKLHEDGCRLVSGKALCLSCFAFSIQTLNLLMNTKGSLWILVEGPD